MNWQILKKRKQPSILLIEQSLLHIITIHIKLYKCNNFIYIKALHTHWALSKKYWFLLHVNNISELNKLYILFFLQDTRDEGWRSHWLEKNTIFSWTILLIKVIKTSKSRDSNNKRRKCKIGVAHLHSWARKVCATCGQCFMGSDSYVFLQGWRRLFSGRTCFLSCHFRWVLWGSQP